MAGFISDDDSIDLTFLTDHEPQSTAVQSGSIDLTSSTEGEPQSTVIQSESIDSTLSTNHISSSVAVQSNFIDLTLTEDDVSFDAIGDHWRTIDPAELVARQDRKRLLLWMLSHTPILRREHAFTHLKQWTLKETLEMVRWGLNAMLGDSTYFIHG